MRLDEPPFVGSEAARAVHGHSAGADVALLGADGDSADLRESLAPFGLRIAGTWGSRGQDHLAALASLADQPGSGALVLVAADLVITPVALLDLLDRPGDPTATVTVEPGAVVTSGDGMTRLRIQADQGLVHSVGTARHAVTAPTHFGLGVLRVSRRDRLQAAQLWRAAASAASATDPSVDPFDLALMVLVRGGVRVSTAPLGPFTARRGADETRGARGSAWQQRLAGASRGGDGFFSTYAVRPLSRRLTGFGLRHNWTPNVVTVCSLGLGLLAAGLAAVDNRWTWVAAAILLLAALVVDCVDGELARFTRRFSALGAWLDAVGDRIKEYSLLAAVAWVAVRRGEDAWLLATVAMVLTTARHLEDYAYADRTKSARAHLVPDAVPVDGASDLGPDGAILEMAAPPTRRELAVHWAKKVMHMPIAERYLLLSLGLLTFNPHWVLWGITIAVGLALARTQGGRTVKALLGSDAFRPHPSLSPSNWGHLDHQLDLGPLGVTARRLLRLPFWAALVGGALVAIAAVLAAREAAPAVVVALVVAGCALVGTGTTPPLRDRLAWQLPAMVWLCESVLVLGLTWADAEPGRWVAFAYLAAVAWHRYDVVYRLRDTGSPSRPWLTMVTLGFDGRMAVLVLLWAVGGPLPGVLAWGALALFLGYAVESALGWRAWSRREAVRAEGAEGAEQGVTA